MKRLTAILLALMVSLSAWGALAAEETELPQKFLNQVHDSGYTGAVTFTVEGNETAAIDPVTFLMLKALAPRITVETGSSYALRQQEGEGVLRILLDGQNVGETVFLYNDELGALSSTLISSADAYYAAPRDWDFAALFSGLSAQENGWPSLWNALARIEQAPQEWHDQVAVHLLPYETKIGVWINGYAAFSTGMEGETAYTQLACSIPAQAVKAQIKQLMVDFFEDEDLLSALREVFTAQEAEYYLQPAMMQTFFSIIDQVQMEGNVEITRRYDIQGNSLLDRISLPFPAGQSLSHLTVSLTPDPDVAGQKWAFQGQCQDGTEFDIFCIAGQDMIYTGSVDILLPEETDDSFAVTDAPARRKIAFDYNLTWDPGQDTYTLATSRYVRTVAGTLLIKPREGSDMATQALSLEARYESGSGKRSATRLNAALSWRDLDTDASITASFTGRTASASAVRSISDYPALRLDQMEEEGMNALTQAWTLNLQSWVQNMAKLLFPGLDTAVPGDG
ncbi:MAG: hypothetical protein IJD39_11535 [Clostridia bacterium]|nr:hypothetical protein [Clostridia bacterium]